MMLSSDDSIYFPGIPMPDNGTGGDPVESRPIDNFTPFHSTEFHQHNSMGPPDDSQRPSAPSAPSFGVAPRFCTVCGDCALGKNFGAITCESCKAFFRRNAFRAENVRCPFNSKCIITVDSRKHCPKCRLDRCFLAGMKPEAVMTKSTQAAKRQRTEDSKKANPVKSNKTERAQNQANTKGSNKTRTTSDIYEIISQGGSSTPAPAATPAPTPVSSVASPAPAPGPVNDTGYTPTAPGQTVGAPEDVDIKVAATLQNDEVVVTMRIPKAAFVAGVDDSISKLGQFLGVDPSHLRKLRAIELASVSEALNDSSAASGSRPDTSQPKHRLEEADTSECEQRGTDVVSASDQSLGPERPENELMEASSTTIPNQQSLQLASPQSFYVELKYLKLEELRAANKAWRRSTAGRPLTGTKAEDFCAQDFAEMNYFMASCLIKQHTCISAFHCFSHDDQMTLIKDTFDDLMFIRTVSYYEEDTGKVKGVFPGQQDVPLEIGKRIRGPIYPKLTEIIASFPSELRCNDAIMLIVSALAFFNPDQPRVRNKRSVEVEREVYMHLLKDYLENTFGKARSRTLLLYLVNFVTALSAWTAVHCRGAFFDVNPVTFDLLLIDFSLFA